MTTLYCPTRRAARAYPKTAHPYDMYNATAPNPLAYGFTDYAGNVGTNDWQWQAGKLAAWPKASGADCHTLSGQLTTGHRFWPNSRA